MKPSYNLFIRRDKINSQGHVPLYLRVTYNRKKSLYFTGIKIEEKYWNPDKKEVRRSHTSYKVLNHELEQLVYEAHEIGFKLDKQKKLSAKNIVDRLKGVNPENFFTYAKKYCDRLDKMGAVRRRKQTTVLLNKLKRMVQADYLELTELTPAFLEDFEIFLRNNIGNAQNTIVKDMERLKMIMDDAFQNEVIDKNPFDVYRKPPRQQSKKEALSIEQILDIKKLDLEEGTRVFHSKNYFLFSFYNAGIRFGDLCRLKWDNIQDGRLRYLMSKSINNTNPKWKNIRLNDQSLEILGYYIKHHNESDYIFPLLEDGVDYSIPEVYDREKSRLNSLVNLDLRKIAELANIETHISFHISRHSFARHAANMGMNMYAISNALAHSNLKTTQTYLKSFDEDLLDREMEQLF